MRILIFIILNLLLVTLSPCSVLAIEPQPQRIISLAPSITESIYFLGAESKLVGVTSFCQFPEQAQRLPKVGGYLDPSLERIVELKPTLVIVLGEHRAVSKLLADLKIPTLLLRHDSVQGILDSLSILQGELQLGESVSERIKTLSDRVAAASRTYAGRARPSVVISVGGHSSEGLQTFYLSGPGSFFDDVIRFSGGENANSASTGLYPSFSLEGLIRLNPDVIIDLQPGQEARRERIISTWKEYQSLQAVRDGRIFVMTESWMVSPGPRVVDIIERFASLLHQG